MLLDMLDRQDIKDYIHQNNDNRCFAYNNKLAFYGSKNAEQMKIKVCIFGKRRTHNV